MVLFLRNRLMRLGNLRKKVLLRTLIKILSLIGRVILICRFLRFKTRYWKGVDRLFFH